MKLIDEALEKIRPRLIEAKAEDSPEISYSSENDYGYFKGNKTVETVGRLRLDFEIADEVLAESEHADIDGLIDVLRADLNDLLLNGDISNPSDPLLKVLDGEKKRGQKATLVDIFSIVLRVEPKPKKESTEYTLYFLLAVDWS